MHEFQYYTNQNKINTRDLTVNKVQTNYLTWNWNENVDVENVVVNACWSQTQKRKRQMSRHQSAHALSQGSATPRTRASHMARDVISYDTPRRFVAVDPKLWYVSTKQLQLSWKFAKTFNFQNV